MSKAEEYRKVIKPTIQQQQVFLPAKFKYTDYDRFLLLKQQISGRASALIDSLDSAQHSYQKAKKILYLAIAQHAS